MNFERLREDHEGDPYFDKSLYETQPNKEPKPKTEKANLKAKPITESEGLNHREIGEAIERAKNGKENLGDIINKMIRNKKQKNKTE
jgi:hypothetical protein